MSMQLIKAETHRNWSGGTFAALLVAGGVSLLASVAVADSYTVPAGTAETVTAQNAETYNAYDSVTVPATSVLDFVGPGTASFTAPLVIKPNATNIVDSGADVALGDQYIYVGGYMRITNATFRTAEPEAVNDATSEQKMILIGKGGSGGARVDIEDGAVVTNRFQLGQGSQRGVVVQSGGDVSMYSSTTDTSTGNKFSGIGYGAYLLKGGTLDVVDNIVIAYSYAGPGVFAMYGGSLTHSYTASDKRYINMATSTGPALYYQAGGTAEVYSFLVNRWDGRCVIALTGEETVLKTTSIACGYRKSAPVPAVVSVAGGACLSAGHALSIRYTSAEYPAGSVMAIANFNGGILRAHGNYSNIDGNDKDAGRLGILRFVVHDGGMTYDMQTHTGNYFNSPLRRATGNGVKAVSWDRTQTFVSAPVVLVEETGGGAGWGASAVAEWDPDTKTVTDVKILSPGCDYTEATAYFNYGSSGKMALETTIGPNAGTGAFTFTGTGTGSGILHLCATNTWGGATTIEHGELQCHNDFAVPADTALKLKGGKLNLANFKATFRSIGGTAGSIQHSPTNAYEVATLDNDTAATLDLSAFSLAVTGRWEIAAADLIAGRHPVYTAALAFGDEASFTVDDFAALDAAGISRVTVLETSGAFTGAPALIGPAGSWALSVTDKTLRLCRWHGFMISVK